MLKKERSFYPGWHEFLHYHDKYVIFPSRLVIEINCLLNNSCELLVKLYLSPSNFFLKIRSRADFCCVRIAWLSRHKLSSHRLLAPGTPGVAFHQRLWQRYGAPESQVLDVCGTPGARRPIGQILFSPGWLSSSFSCWASSIWVLSVSASARKATRRSSASMTFSIFRKWWPSSG